MAVITGVERHLRKIQLAPVPRHSQAPGGDQHPGITSGGYYPVTTGQRRFLRLRAPPMTIRCRFEPHYPSGRDRLGDARGLWYACRGQLPDTLCYTRQDGISALQLVAQEG